MLAERRLLFEEPVSSRTSTLGITEHFGDVLPYVGPGPALSARGPGVWGVVVPNRSAVDAPRLRVSRQPTGIGMAVPRSTPDRKG